MKYLMTVALRLALVTTVVLFLACGDDDGGEGPVDASLSQGATSPTNGASGEEIELELTVENTEFDKNRLKAPAGSEVSLTLNNQDSVEHNFSLYESEDSDDGLFEGPLLPGPAFLIYQFTAPEGPGTYRFQCDVHPDVMKGEFIVE